MSKKTAFIDLGFLRLDRRKQTSLAQQLYHELREAILSGQIKKGHRLPSTRELASDLRVSRMTVVNAFDQLMLEGYLSGNVGRGTFVNDQLPEEKLRVKFCEANIRQQSPQQTSTKKLFSKQGRRFTGNEFDQGLVRSRFVPFQSGIPAVDEFPLNAWAKMRRNLWKHVQGEHLSYGDAAGYRPLREAIADYARVSRGVKFDDDQVVIVSGTQQAADAIARLATSPDDEIIFENPGYGRARAVFLAARTNVVSVPVDQCGLNVDEAIDKAPNARIAYVTPSHQYPMGVTLSIERRIQLIDWANRTGALIFEDDYDAEFRYCQQPIPAMQGLDQGGRTVYCGSLSKVIYPSLSIGYVILPKAMVEPFVKAICLTSRPPSTFDQMAITEFIVNGDFARHLRRMRSIHEERCTTLTTCIQEELSDHLTIVGADAGLHCATWLNEKYDDVEISRRADKIGILVRPLSEYVYPLVKKSQEKKTKHLNGLVFGFACCTPEQIRSSVKKLAQVFD